MKTQHHSISLLSTTLLILALAACSKSPEQQLADSKALMAKADYKTAIIELKGVTQQQPNNREARLALGNAYLASEAYADAEKELNKARELGIDDNQVLASLAKSIIKQGLYKKVLELTPAQNSKPSPQSISSFQVTRAQAFLALNRRSEADQAISTATNADAQYPELLLLKGLIASLDNKPTEALSLIDAAIKINPKLNEALYFKASILQKNNKINEALDCYKLILANDNKQFKALLAISELKLRQNNAQEAEQALLAAEKIAKNVPAVNYTRGMFELSRGKPKEANEAFLLVLRVSPDHIPSLLAQGIASFSLGNYEQSLTNAQKVVAKIPGNTAASRLLAASKLKTGDSKGAWEILEPLVRSDAKDPQLFNLAAEIQLQLGDTNKALDYLDRAAAIAPNNPDLIAQQGLGRLLIGQNARGLADLEKAARLNGKPSKADTALILYYMKQGQFDSALGAISNLEKKQPNNPEVHSLRASALLGKNDKSGARSAFEQSLSIKPNFIPAAMGLARLDLLDNNPAAARKRFESILKADSSNLQAMIALADLAISEKKENEYVSWLEKAVNTNPNAAQPIERLVRFYLAKKNNEKALGFAKQFVASNPDNSQALALLGSAQNIAGSKADAISSYTTLVEKNKNSPQAHLQLALAFIRDKRMDQGRHSILRALQIKPDFLPAQDALIRLELSELHPESAIKVARQIQQQNLKSPIGYDREGDIHISQRAFTLAAKAYDQALTQQYSLDTFTKLHRALYLAGDRKTAEKRLLARIQSNPKDIALKAYAAEVFMDEHRNHDAIAQYEALLKVAPTNVVALNNLADLYFKVKDPRALNTAEQALKLAPNHPGIMDTVGWILAEQGQLPHALTLLRKAAENSPQSAAIRYHLGVTLQRSGDRAGARKELEAAVTHGQKSPEIVNSAKMLLKSL